MNDVCPLPVTSLRWNCDPEQFDFRSTDELPDLREILGQVRALDAVKFGVAIRREGFNLFVLGPPGIGKQTLVRRCLDEKAVHEPTPPDWCYVNNFDDLRRPRAISLPAGRGMKLRTDTADLVEDMETTIPAVLETDEHRSRVQMVEREEAERQSQVFEELAKKSLAQGIRLLRTPGGFALAPIRNGDVLSPDEFHKLSADEQRHIEETVASLQGELQAIIEQIPKWHKEHRDRLTALHREAVQRAIGHLINRTTLSMSASLVFEQSYGKVDGDSASVAELCVLLSALAEVPIKQTLAVTGSVNQHGEVQAVGGVNEKIEGFFDVCRQRGLTGEQGVLMPATNVRHLMLRPDVAAAADGFHIYPIENVDQAITLLTGVPAGERGIDGLFPAGSINQRVEARLHELARLRQEFGQNAGERGRERQRESTP